MSRASAPLGAALGLVVDRVLGEPPTAVHPVAGFGRLMAAFEQAIRPETTAGTGNAAARGPSGTVEPAVGAGAPSAVGTFWNRQDVRRLATTYVANRRTSLPGWAKSGGTGGGAGGAPPRSWRDGRGAGAGYAAVGVGLGAAAGAALGGSLAAGAVATWVVVAGRALGEEAQAIGERLAAGDPEGARRRLPALVGRDPDSLDAKGVARAVVESVAENTVDAVVAPACWAAAGGAAGAGVYRAVNTLDAMVGHRNERYLRFGWASARLDDAANWVPARLAGLLVAVVRPGRAREVLDAVVSPPAHPSPNAGVVEAAFAAALGLRLGGDTVYAGRVHARPSFGTGRPPEPADIDAAVRLSRDVTLALAALLASPSLLRALRRIPWRGRPAPR